MNKARKPIATLDEVRALLAEFPTADLEAASRTATREAVLTKPAGALGRLEGDHELAGELAGPPPAADRAAARLRLCRATMASLRSACRPFRPR